LLTGLGRREFMGAATGGALGLFCSPAIARSGVFYESGLRLLEAGEVKPAGWIKQQLKRDLERGITGHYDRINPTVAHDLFVAADRKSSPIGIPVITATRRPAWWSGEHEGYWKDAVTRTAFLTGDEDYMARARGWMESIASHQGGDGYIGIYRPGNRFNHRGENGELWTQSRIMVAMLAFHEFTGDAGVFHSVVKAVDLAMSKYGPGRGYFRNSNSRLFNGGMSHGLAFVDVLEWLYRKTGGDDYRLFAEFLYRDFSEHCVCNNDMALSKLLDRDKKFYLHGPHVAEHFMIPFFLARTTGKEEYRRAADNAIHKLRYHLTPGGALVSYENVNGVRGSADALYEYCSITELAISLIRVMQFTGSIEAADMVERMTMNAGQGARLAVLEACSYLTSDNRDTINRRGYLGREGYSASHSAAACCTLNAGRLMPHYVSGMWMRMKDPEGLAAMLYGPCQLETAVRGVKVKIKEDTDYPHSDRIVFSIDPDSPLAFSLFLRRPGFGGDVKTEAPGCQVRKGVDFIELRKKWNKGDKVTLVMEPEVETVRDPAGGLLEREEFYVQRGPLLYALKIPARMKKVREHGESGFYDYAVSPAEDIRLDYSFIDGAGFELIRNPGADPQRPWEKAPLSLACEMRDAKGRTTKTEFVPEGCTVLRRVSFPKSG